MVFPSGLRPISIAEFAVHLRRCTPPSGWPSTIAVANSGGPDSACLLYLLHSAFRQSRTEHDEILSGEVISLNVDHGLQDSSAHMSHVAGQIATRFHAQHVTARVLWGTDVFPPIPKHGIETVARSARYRVILDQMQHRGVHILAVGHHAFDQHETILMRLNTGFGEERIPLGMSYVRRWGMGQGHKSDLRYHGMHGMDRWIIRPLLGFGKDRILATCEEQRIEYVTDKTNFQPDLTLRNGIRAELNQKSSQISVSKESQTLDVDATKLSRERLNDLLSGGYTCQTQDALNRLMIVCEADDRYVDSTLSRILDEYLPAPGTFVLPANEIQALSPSMLRSLVLRLLRYISPHPWGSPAAEAHRDSASIGRIIEALVISADTADQSSRPHGPRSFTAGGGVLWSPVVIKPDRQYVHREAREGERLGWLLTRSPPYNRRTCGESSTLPVDLTDWIALPTEDLRNKWVERSFDQPIGPQHALDLFTWLSSYKDEENVILGRFLWDNRFLLTFDLGRVQALLQTMDHSRLVIMANKSKGSFTPSVKIVNSDNEWVTIGDAYQATSFVSAKFIRPLGR